MTLILKINPNMKGDTPLVAIKCITYNHEPYIKQCLQGFIMQKTNFPFVAIVHDDASTDGTAAIIKEFAEKYPNIIKPIYEIENQYSKRDGTIRRIMDRAIEQTGCKYVAMCEGDDYWTSPYKLQRQVDFLEANLEYSASTHQSIIIGNSEKSGEFFRRYVPSCIEMKDIVSNSRLFHTASIVYRREVYDLPEFKGRILSGDKLLILKCAAIGKINFFNEPMCVYRKHEGGVSSSVKLSIIKSDEAIIPYMCAIYPKFPKYRYLSFLYGTFAMYPNDVSLIKRLKYLFLSFLYSFSFFPENIVVIARKIFNHAK